MTGFLLNAVISCFSTETRLKIKCVMANNLTFSCLDEVWVATCQTVHWASSAVFNKNFEVFWGICHVVSLKSFVQNGAFVGNSPVLCSALVLVMVNVFVLFFA